MGRGGRLDQSSSVASAEAPSVCKLEYLGLPKSVYCYWAHRILSLTNCPHPPRKHLCGQELITRMKGLSPFWGICWREAKTPKLMKLWEFVFLMLAAVMQNPSPAKDYRCVSPGLSLFSLLHFNRLNVNENCCGEVLSDTEMALGSWSRRRSREGGGKKIYMCIECFSWVLIHTCHWVLWHLSVCSHCS